MLLAQAGTGFEHGSNKHYVIEFYQASVWPVGEGLGMHLGREEGLKKVYFTIALPHFYKKKGNKLIKFKQKIVNICSLSFSGQFF